MNQRFFTKSAIGVAIAGATIFVASSAFATPMNSIADSWHNLGANNSKTATPNGGSPANKSQATGEICVFCHTPHGGDTSAAVPLWNRKLANPSTYTVAGGGGRYSDNGTTTFDASEGPIGSVTIACLSCHDGAQAIDALINAPGSGNYTPVTETDVTKFYAWAGGTRISGDDITNGMLKSTIVQNLGTDLRNDHPVSMQYAGGGFTGSAGTIAGTPKDPDFTTSSPRTVTKANGAGTYQVFLDAEGHGTLDTVFWIERGAESKNATGRDRSDIIFYTRSGVTTTNGTPGGTQPFVECGSCHDPHNVENPTFLRTSNGIPGAGTLFDTFPLARNDAASGLCLTCHAK
jgi:hypothetical protein